MYNDRQKKTTWYIKLRRKKARNKKQKNKNIVNGKNIVNKKEKKTYCQYEVNWENVLTNSIGKGLFTGPNKALVNTLALLPIMLPYAFGHFFL